jgi:hypothetical protein
MSTNPKINVPQTIWGVKSNFAETDKSVTISKSLLRRVIFATALEREVTNG